MANPFVGQLILAAWNFAPRNYSLCNGQLVGINTNQALFALLGTTFGGDGIRTFGLPDLQGRTPISCAPDSGLPMGASAGTPTHTLIAAEVPGHTHTFSAASNKASLEVPTGAILAQGDQNTYAPASNLTTMRAGTIGTVGGQPHENEQPYLVMNWCISLYGVFPTRD